MKIGFVLSTKGGSPLQSGMERGLRRCGHEVEDYQPNREYDLLLVWNQCAHTIDYTYPRFPKGNTPIAFIDTAEYGYFKRLPAVADDYLNLTSRGSLEHDTKNKEEQLRLIRYLEGKSFPYFLREMYKWKTWPATYHPIDYPLFVSSHCAFIPHREDYLARSLDLFCYWGGSHPWRLPLTQALRDAHVKSEIAIIDVDVPRMDQPIYFNGIERAKCSVSFDGYGSSSFRLTEVLVRGLLLRGPLSIIRWKDLIPGVHCLDYEVHTKGEEYLGTNIREVLYGALADPETSFSLYEAGHQHCLQYYTEQATAKYVLDVIEKHDWTKPTQLNLC